MLSPKLCPNRTQDFPAPLFDLYGLSVERGFELVCPIQRYESTSGERPELIHFYVSDRGQVVYSWRSKSVAPLEQLKDVFGIEPSQVRGFD